MEEASTEIGSLSMEMSELVGVVIEAARTRLSGGECAGATPRRVLSRGPQRIDPGSASGRTRILRTASPTSGRDGTRGQGRDVPAVHMLFPPVVARDVPEPRQISDAQLDRGAVLNRRPGHAGSGGFAAPIARSRTRRAGSSTSRHRRCRCRPGARGSLQRGDQMTARVGQCGDPGGAGRIGRAGHKTP
jgi:hypothetical protein